MLNLVNSARPSMTPAAMALSHEGLRKYSQNTKVAATPRAVEPTSVVISRQCARMFGQNTQRLRLSNPPRLP